MLHDREQLDVGVTHLLDVGDQFAGEFAIGQPAISFVRISAVDPRFVIPGVAIDGADDGGVLRPDLAGEAIGIRFQPKVVTDARQNFKFVNLAVSQFRDENFPDPAGLPGAHGVNAAIPEIEISHHADALRIRSPYRELHAAHAFDVADVSAKFFVFQVVSTFAEQVEIVIAKHRRKRVGIKSVKLIAIRKAEVDAVRSRSDNLTRSQAREVRRQDDFKYARRMNL